MGRRGGFTLIELMIVIAIIAVIAAIAIPNLIEARKASNEASAIQTLRTIHTAQTLFRDRDYDQDGQADFCAVIYDLAGLIDQSLATPAPGPFTLGNGRRSGYNIGMVFADTVDWGAVADPVSFGRSGDRAFFIDQSGVIRFSTTAYSPATPVSTLLTWPPIGG